MHKWFLNVINMLQFDTSFDRCSIQESIQSLSLPDFVSHFYSSTLPLHHFFFFVKENLNTRSVLLNEPRKTSFQGIHSLKKRAETTFALAHSLSSWMFGSKGERKGEWNEEKIRSKERSRKEISRFERGSLSLDKLGMR